MSTVTINGKTYVGDNISIFNGNVYINGKLEESNVSGVVEIRVVDGILQSLSSDASISCGNVGGNVSAGGSVNCDDVHGNVDAGGSVIYG